MVFARHIVQIVGVLVSVVGIYLTVAATRDLPPFGGTSNDITTSAEDPGAWSRVSNRTFATPPSINTLYNICAQCYEQSSAVRCTGPRLQSSHKQNEC